MRLLGNGSYQLRLSLIAIINAIVMGYILDLAFKKLSLLLNKKSIRKIS